MSPGRASCVPPVSLQCPPASFLCPSCVPPVSFLCPSYVLPTSFLRPSRGSSRGVFHGGLPWCFQCPSSVFPCVFPTVFLTRSTEASTSTSRSVPETLLLMLGGAPGALPTGLLKCRSSDPPRICPALLKRLPGAFQCRCGVLPEALLGVFHSTLYRGLRKPSREFQRRSFQPSFQAPSRRLPLALGNRPS